MRNLQQRKLSELLLFLVLCLFAVPGFLHAEFIELKEGRGFLYPLVDWSVFGEMTDDSLAMTDSENSTVFQIMTFPVNEFSSSVELAEAMEQNLTILEKDTSSFLFEGLPAILSDIVFTVNGVEHRGYFFFYRGQKYGYYLLAMTLKEEFGDQHDKMLSILDSFAPEKTALSHPGLVSQLLAPYPPQETISVEIAVPRLRDDIPPGIKDTVLLGKDDLEMCQVVIEREARLMFPYAEEINNEAWLRYYQMIMRDYHARLKPVSLLLSPIIESYSQREKAETLLTWIQSFDYQREEGTASDLLSPLTCALSSTGDCDSRALLYLSLLRYEGIDGVLMVSSEYSHAMAAVNVEGSGARFYPAGKEPQGYVVAETTDQIDLGLIDRSMADPAKWLSVSFPREFNNQ